MAQLNLKIGRLEQNLRRYVEENPLRCRYCQGMPLVVFEDDPTNLWPYGSDGRCGGCGATPPRTTDMKLSRLPGLKECFAAIPFSPDPLYAKLERCMLFTAIFAKDERQAEHILKCILERHEAKQPLRSSWRAPCHR